MADKTSKNYRILDIYVRLSEGKEINKETEAQKYGVDQRSIQRDIDDIRAFMDNRSVENYDDKTIIYDRAKKAFVMSGTENSILSNSEILAISKILLESRAFTKKEVSSILKKLVDGCVPLKNMKLVSALIANEKYHYVELHNKSCIKDKLWELGESIKESNILKIRYCKQGADIKDSIKRTVEPTAIIFSEYYFYLIAYIVEKDENNKYVHKYDYPAVFRIDRITRYKITDDKFKVIYSNRFEEGEFRKRVQFMYPGTLTKLCFKYTGKSVEAILDRLPTAQIISNDSNGYIIKAEVYGKGILMWLLSQGTNIEILKPTHLREEMKKILTEMLEKYN